MRKSVIGAFLWAASAMPAAAYSIDDTVSFDSVTGLYTYTYVVGDVPPGARVANLTLQIKSGGPQANLPFDIDIPLYWSMVPAGNTWRFDTNSADNWIGAGEILEGETGTFSFKTHYAPWSSLASLGVSESELECCYNAPLVLFPYLQVPHYTGEFEEVLFTGHFYNYPPGCRPGQGVRRGGSCFDVEPIPEPASLVLLGAGLIGFAALRRRDRAA